MRRQVFHQRYPHISLRIHPDLSGSLQIYPEIPPRFHRWALWGDRWGRLWALHLEATVVSGRVGGRPVKDEEASSRRPGPSPSKGLSREVRSQSYERE